MCYLGGIWRRLEQLEGIYGRFPTVGQSGRFAGVPNLVNLYMEEGGVRVCGDAVLRYFWCGFAVIFISTRGIAVSKH